MRVGLLVSGDVSVRAAHSLQAHPGIDDVVVVGPATSKSFPVVDDAGECDVLVGSGPDAPELAVKHGVGLIWDGLEAAPGALVWGASPQGIALALAAREPDPRLVALAHPDCPQSRGTHTVRFPDPVGRLEVHDDSVDGRPLATAKATNGFAACLVEGVDRRVAVIDHAGFMSGVALAAGVALSGGVGGPVWSDALAYLETATEMGLVMAESG
ncbi:MAG TPA: hypothetical protein VFS66_00225 [Acidimicrobiia bacterium]|nr:hypothetical protein [Acidimicrobiia bacterium]